ncbi:MAG: N-6 DNA methylase [Halanaerobiales bacterium]|nr:N-6 DNA methylase [Halanaerobiales bacterium]
MVEKTSIIDEINIVQEYINNSGNDSIDDVKNILEILINYQNNTMNINKSNPYYEVIKEMILLGPKEKFQVLSKVINNNINKKELPIFIPENILEMIAEQLDIIKEEKNLNILLTNNEPELLERIYYNMNIDQIDIYSDKISNKNIYENLYKVGEIGEVNFVEENIVNTDLERKYDLIFSPILFNSKKVDFNNKKVDIKEAALQATLQRLKDDGYIFGVVKDGVLNNKQFEDLRERILDNFDLLSIIEFPKTILYKNRAVNTSLLIIKNSKEKNDKVFLAHLEKDTQAEKNNLLNKFNSYFKDVVE